MSAAVAFADVSVARGGRDVLHDLDFTIDRGEFVGVIGGNGAGKTTLLSAMLGAVRARRGSIEVLGKPVARANRAIGYVPQKIAFDRDLPLRGRDFVALGIDGWRYGLPRSSRASRERVAVALEEVGATAYADAPLGRLSGGEQQRLSIAQAIVARPELLLLDEPLANLDLRGADDVVHVVAQLRERSAMTIVLVTHDINPLLGRLDRVLYLANGRAAIGTVPDVVNDDVLGALYGTHVDVLHVHGRIIVVTGADPTDVATVKFAHDAPA